MLAPSITELSNSWVTLWELIYQHSPIIHLPMFWCLQLLPIHPLQPISSSRPRLHTWCWRAPAILRSTLHGIYRCNSIWLSEANTPIAPKPASPIPFGVSNSERMPQCWRQFVQPTPVQEDLLPNKLPVACFAPKGVVSCTNKYSPTSILRFQSFLSWHSAYHL